MLQQPPQVSSEKEGVGALFPPYPISFPLPLMMHGVATRGDCPASSLSAVSRFLLSSPPEQTSVMGERYE
jgi:hypothetical protein